MNEKERIVLIGASGFVGSALLEEALNRGHQVTAVVRNPAKITMTSPNLFVVKADVSSADTVADVCRGFSTVISAFNPGWKNPDIYDDTMRIYSAILEGVKKAGVKRLLCVGGAGSLFIAPGLRLMDSGSVPPALLPGVKAMGDFYLNVLCREEEIDWVFLSPAADMRPGKRTGKFRTGKDNLIEDERGNSVISVEDFAVAMLNELENPVHHRERFTIGY